MPTPKSPDDILQQEFLKERAEVLGRAGARVSEALQKLRRIEERITAGQGRYEELAHLFAEGVKHDRHTLQRRVKLLREINAEIGKFNQAREDAKLGYYYLIVTREALGLRRHHWVEEIYCIPPKKATLQDN